MNKNSVNLGGGGANGESRVWVNCWSPFAFETLKGYPKWTWALPFTTLFFFLIWHGYERNFNTSYALQKLGGVCDLHSFLQTERGKKPHNPTILIAGNCLGGDGISSSILEKRLGQPVGKTSISWSNIWENLAIIRKHTNETKNVRVALVAVDPSNMVNNNRVSIHKTRYLALKQIGEKPISVPQSAVTFIEKYLPFRYSIRDIKKSLTCYEKTFEEIIALAPSMKEKCANINTIVQIRESYIEQRTRHLVQSSQSINNIPDYINYGETEDLHHCYFELADYCNKKNIYLIYVVVPTYGGGFFSHGATGVTDTCSRDFVRILSKLNSMPHCSVIATDLLSDIFHCDTSDYYFDLKHMCPKGAALYTNWLADQIQKDPKIMAALKTPRKPEEFFVKKYTKKGYRKIVSWLKTSKPKQETTQKPVLAAQPKNPVK